MGVVVLKEVLLTVSTLGVCCGLERAHFYQFLPWEDMVVLRGPFLTVSTVGGCGSSKRTDF